MKNLIQVLLNSYNLSISNHQIPIKDIKDHDRVLSHVYYLVSALIPMNEY